MYGFFFLLFPVLGLSYLSMAAGRRGSIALTSGARNDIFFSWIPSSDVKEMVKPESRRASFGVGRSMDVGF